MKCYACKLKVIQLNHLQPFKIPNDIGLFVSTKTRLLSCTVNKVGNKEKHDFYQISQLYLFEMFTLQNKENKKIVSLFLYQRKKWSEKAMKICWLFFNKILYWETASVSGDGESCFQSCSCIKIWLNNFKKVW